MNGSLNESERELWRQIDSILLKDWDPIGVYGYGADDEYSSYVPHIFKLAIGGAIAPAIADALAVIRHQYIGLSPRDDQSEELRIAEQIIRATSETLG